VYSEYLTKEALEGVGDIQTVQVIGTVKWEYDLVMLAKEGTVWQSMIDKSNWNWKMLCSENERGIK
jgi:hypothetical protein